MEGAGNGGRLWDPRRDTRGNRGQPQQQQLYDGVAMGLQDGWHPGQLYGDQRAGYAMGMQPASAPAPMPGGEMQMHNQSERERMMGQAMGMGQMGMRMQMGGAGQAPYQQHVDPALEYAANMRAQAAGWDMQGMHQHHQYHGMGYGGHTMGYEGVQRPYQGVGGMMQQAGMARAGAGVTTPYEGVAQQLAFTPAAGVAENVAMGMGSAEAQSAGGGGEVPGTPPRAGADRTRPRVESPQRGETSVTHPVWDDTWLRELTIEEALVEAQLDGADVGELLEVPDGITWPPDELLASMEAHSRGTSQSRNAAVVKWLGSAFEGMVLTKHVMFLVMGERQTVESTTMEAVRDGLIEVFPWAHNVTVGDDYAWPEIGQKQDLTSKHEVALRIIWIEAILRLALAARHGEEQLVRHMSERSEEVREREDARAANSVIRDVANTPSDSGAVQLKFGTAVMEAHGAMVAAAHAISGEADFAEMRRNKMTKTLVMKLARRMRNAVAEDEERRLPAGVSSRARDLSDARRGFVAAVGTTAGVTIKRLPHEHSMTALRNVVRDPAEMYMCEAAADETIVRQIHDAVDLAAKQPHTDAVTAFAKKIMAHANREEAGDAFKSFAGYVAMLSPLAVDFEPPGSEYGSEMSRRLAWIRSDSPEGMMKLLAMRIQECQERSTPGTVGRDSDMASPERRRQRSGVTGSTASEADRRASEMMRNAGLVPPPAPATAGHVPQPMPTMPAMPVMPGWPPSMPPYGMPHGVASGGGGVDTWGGGLGPPPMAAAFYNQMYEMNRPRYGGTRQEDALIESFNDRGQAPITVPMALAMRSAIPGDVMNERAASDVQLRDTVMPGGISRKVEMVASELKDEEFFPGEPQIALFLSGKTGRADGFVPAMFQKMTGWSKHRGSNTEEQIEVAAKFGMRGRAAVRNLPKFPPVNSMETYENMVEGFVAVAHHAPAEMVAGLREFFSIQRKHYQNCSKAGLTHVTYATLYSDLCDRLDQCSTHVDRRQVGRILMLPRWDVLPKDLSASMVLREQQLKQILDALRAESGSAGASPLAVPTGAAPPKAAPPTPAAETRKERQARERKEANDAKAKAGDAKKTAASEAALARKALEDKRPPAANKSVGPCFEFVKGRCTRGAQCRFSHDQAVIDQAKANYQPAAVGEQWAQKWIDRNEPSRQTDPPARVRGTTAIAGAWVLAKDRWSICEQTNGKCFARHVECKHDCNCSLCQTPNGKQWPKMVAVRVRPAAWQGDE